MPEVTPDATLIIATSWQALGRAETGDERASICNCTVIIVFAAFFLEANLNRFIERVPKGKGAGQPPGDHDGLQRKLAWIYNSFVAHAPTLDPAPLALELEREFPRFEAIRKFRNDVSHGIIDRSAATLATAKELRLAVKAMVDKLLDLAERNGFPIDRGIEYEMAISTTDAGAAA